MRTRNSDAVIYHSLSLQFFCIRVHIISARTLSDNTRNIVHREAPFRLKQQTLGFDNMYSTNLELVRPLDREVVDYYIIEIVASDGGNPPRSDKMTLQIKVCFVGSVIR